MGEKALRKSEESTEYELVFSSSIDNMVDSCMDYLINDIKNPDAASHLADEITEIYDRMEYDPYQFPRDRNSVLFMLGYRRVHLSSMRYHFEIRIVDHVVYVDGFFHDLEDYAEKMKMEFKISKIDEEEE